MKRLLLFVAIIAMLTFSCVNASAQSSDNTYTLNVEDILSSYDLGGNDMIVNAGDSQMTLSDPILIRGSGTDIVEQQGVTRLLSHSGFDLSRITDDTSQQFEGKDIRDYDTIVLGGPNHNSYAKQLMDEGYLRYTTTDKKMPTIIIDSFLGPNGHRVIILGDAGGYDYHKKDLPLNGIIPEKYAPAAAVTAGAGIGLLAIFFSKIVSFLGMVFGKLTGFASGYVAQHVQEKASDIEAGMTGVKAKKHKSLFLGISGFEILIALAGAILLGAAYILADRLGLTPDGLGLYLLVAGVATVGHDLAHKLLALKLKTDSEYQFWALGTVTMFLTSWLFGVVFAQPARTITDGEKLKPREEALIALGGPAISLILALMFLMLVPFKYSTFGAGIATVGVLGFSMNMLSTVYSLMPFKPMDGNRILGWSKVLWAALFIPTLLFYLAMLIFIL